MSAPEQPAGWYLYRFYAPTTVRCAVEGCTLRHPLYIGKSNEPWRREKEHARKKAWYQLSLLPGGGWMIDERTFATDRAVRAAELDAIHEELPLANEDGNEGNAHRLVFDDQPVMPRTVARQAKSARVVAESAPWWTPGRRKVAYWLTGWVTGTGVFAALLVHYLLFAAAPAVKWGAAGSTLATAAVGVVTVGVWYGRLSRRKQLKVKRRVGAVVTATIVATIGGGVLWLLLAGHAVPAVSR